MSYSYRRSAMIVSHLIVILGLSASLPATAQTTDFESQLHEIQTRWAEVNYNEKGKQQKNSFASLLDNARALAAAHPQTAEALIWQGIVASSYAGLRGPLGAMSLAKEARDALLAAEQLDPSALDGSTYTSLGVLYYKVPGGLIGFGDKQMARDYLEKALALNPTGIDPNYFYGEFLYEQKDYEGAERALLKAQVAPPRDGRAVADAGRREEVAALLSEVRKHIDHRS